MLQAKCKIVLAFAALLMLGCSGSPSTTELPSGGGPGEDGPPGGEEGLVDNSGFWVSAVGYPGYTAKPHTRRSTGYDDYCLIGADETFQNIDCIVDVREADLYVLGIGLQYNVPNGMCKYLVRRTYWYYNRSVGYGPGNVVINRTYDAAEALTASSCTVDGSGAAACTNANFNEVNFSLLMDEASVSCVYSCCEGSYMLTVNDDKTASGGNLDTTVSMQSWGGSFSDCVGGSARTSWSHFNSKNMPIGVIVSNPAEGINAIHKLEPPIDTLMDSNMILSNYYDSAAHNHVGFVDPTPSSLPYCVTPIDDINGDPINPAHPSYTYDCLDEAREVRNRINVYIRDWDTNEQFNLYHATRGVTEVPDLWDGDEGVDCDGVAGKCNDYWDLDDLLQLVNGGVYDTTDHTLLRNFYPNETYPE